MLRLGGGSGCVFLVVNRKKMKHLKGFLSEIYFSFIISSLLFCQVRPLDGFRSGQLLCGC